MGAFGSFLPSFEEAPRDDRSFERSPPRPGESQLLFFENAEAHARVPTRFRWDARYVDGGGDADATPKGAAVDVEAGDADDSKPRSTRVGRRPVRP